MFAEAPASSNRSVTAEGDPESSRLELGSRRDITRFTRNVSGNALRDLLSPYKTVTDPIHDDISVTRLETNIVDTRAFQRLHSFRQLASAYRVYPSAVHTRFEHALGTMAQAQAMISRINDNPDKEEPIIEQARLLTRLAALLHDIPYVPFGHELEDEARLVARHETRYDDFLAPDAEIGEIINRELGSDLLRLLKHTLEAKGEEQIEALEYPFVSDIVGNTICADLMDYLKRDNYFTGLKEHFGNRFMSYFVVSKMPSGSRRLVVRLEKKGTLRRDVLSELVHLLRARYTLGERVYFHHAKQVASAMISKAVYLANVHNDPNLAFIGDDELLHKLENSSNKDASFIATSLRARRLFKSVYSVGEYHARHSKERLAEELYQSPAGRSAVEEELAHQCGFPPADVIVYCPDPQMSLKQAGVKVRWIDDAIHPLNEITDDPPSGEIKELEAKHKALWRLSVFLRADLIDSKGQEVSDACFHRWRIVNENPLFATVGLDPARASLYRLGRELKLTVPVLDQLEQMAARSDEPWPTAVEEWRLLYGNLEE